MMTRIALMLVLFGTVTVTGTAAAAPRRGHEREAAALEEQARVHRERAKRRLDGLVEVRVVLQNLRRRGADAATLTRLAARLAAEEADIAEELAHARADDRQASRLRQ